ncbi:hypothetical protein DQ04_02051080 [Trypanosoma grayi]|uniref:hypothetical protein n=1 Tax=Trypanosoma grayi TaxID=71804 RepID=UPI0004F4B707|nr:hypothetical protein DQ04_02051080 [Trypanosoma grayi]KEG12043.1 hypothetical protein DQ04_02051080 [Trypanosoma grayi]
MEQVVRDREGELKIRLHPVGPHEALNGVADTKAHNRWAAPLSKRWAKEEVLCLIVAAAVAATIGVIVVAGCNGVIRRI